MRPAPGSSSAVRTAGLVLLVWVVLAGLVAGVGWLLTHPLQASVEPWDDDISRWFEAQRSPALDPWGDAGTLLGDTIVGMGVAAAAALGFSLWRRSVLPAVYLGLVTAGVGGIYALATHLAPRQRPPVEILDTGLVPDHSFPSGHVGTSTAVYGGILVLAWVYAAGARRWAWVLLVLPVADLLARLYQGAHHLTDVLTSAVYACVWLLVLARLVLPGKATVEP